MLKSQVPVPEITEANGQKPGASAGAAVAAKAQPVPTPAPRAEEEDLMSTGSVE
jgi:hypothetical protein